VYEVLPLNNSLSDLIGRGVTTAEFREAAKRGGMTSLRESAVRKAFRGETSIDEVFRETAD